MSATAQRLLRIGELAERTGTTPRTIRYYEEIGLLGSGDGRQQGQHRAYAEADVARVQEIVRLKELLGLSLEQLSKLLEAESARADLRREYHEIEDPARRREILHQALGHLDTQLELVRARRAALKQLERDLNARRERVVHHLDGRSEP